MIEEKKCKWNKKDDCNDCSYEGCPSYGASLEKGDLEEGMNKK